MEKEKEKAKTYEEAWAEAQAILARNKELALLDPDLAELYKSPDDRNPPSEEKPEVTEFKKNLHRVKWNRPKQND